MRTAHHEFAGGRVERFASVEERSTTRMKSRFSYDFSALAASGKPSANRSVPNRVSTGSGVATSAGIVVVIAIFFDRAVDNDASHLRAQPLRNLIKGVGPLRTARGRY
jgi:hypothetical protein